VSGSPLPHGCRASSRPTTGPLPRDLSVAATSCPLGRSAHRVTVAIAGSVAGGLSAAQTNLSRHPTTHPRRPPRHGSQLFTPRGGSSRRSSRSRPLVAGASRARLAAPLASRSSCSWSSAPPECASGRRSDKSLPASELRLHPLGAMTTRRTRGDGMKSMRSAALVLAAVALLAGCGGDDESSDASA